MTIHTTPVDIVTSSNVTNPPTGYVRLYADVSGNLFTRSANGSVISVNSNPGLAWNSFLANTTVTNNATNPAVWTTFTITPARCLFLKATALFNSSNTANQIGFGIRVTHPSGATSATLNGPTQAVGGIWLSISNAPGAVNSANIIENQSQILVATGTTQTFFVNTSSVVTSGIQGATCNAMIKNLSNNVTTSVDLVFYGSNGNNTSIYAGSTAVGEFMSA